MKVFIVFGHTGEYSDRHEWPVRGFLSKEKAETFEFECTKHAEAFKTLRDKSRDSNDYDWFNEDQAMPTAVPGDPSFRCDYTGTDYYTVDVEVDE